MRQKSGPVKKSAEKVVKDIRRATRRQFSAEKKIRIVLEGLRGEESIAELCRREGIVQNLYYRWSKDFLAGDTARAATSDEVKDLRCALVAASLPGVDPVLKVSIIPRGVGALGYTIQHPTEDRFLLAASELRKRIAVLMGGRAAEVLVFEGDVSTGAADDLQRATDIATEMVTLYGMEKTIGQRTYKSAPQGFLSGQVLDKPVASETTLREIDLSVRDTLATAFEEARSILTKRRADLDQGAELLLSKEVIRSDDFPALQQTKAGERPAVTPADSS